MSDTSTTDWARIDAMTDDDIDTSDISPLSDDFFENVELRLPTYKTTTINMLAVDYRHDSNEARAHYK